MRYPALAAVLLLASPVAAAAPPGDAAVRARHVFKTHCAECHKPGGRSALDLLDHPAVVSATGTRDPLPRFVARGNPDKSQIIQFVEDGSMPPGRRAKLSKDEIATLREWVATGAVAYPARFDDVTVLGWIAADAATLPDDDRKDVRYLTLHHLIPDADPAPPLEPLWAAVRAALGRVTVDPPALTPVDPTGAVMRWDLRAAGWHATPFQEIDIESDRNVRKLPLTVFDAVLLEYPFARPVGTDPTAERVRTEFLRRTAQVRPVPFVRADWLAAAVADPRLAADIRGLLKRSGPLPPAPALPATFPKEPFAVPPVPGAIPPLDGYYAADPPAAGAPAVTVRALTVDGAPASKFRPGDQFYPEVTAATAGRFELIYVGTDATVFVFNLTAPDADRLRANVAEVLYVGGDKAAKAAWPIDPKSPPGRERLTAYFSDKPFPRGVKVRAVTDTGKVERFYHPLPPGGDPSGLAPVVRTTTGFEIVGK